MRRTSTQSSRSVLGVAGGLFALSSLALTLSAPSCGYAPDFANDTLQCGANNACPKGYSCASNNRCWKDGTNPVDSGSTDMRLANYVGTWTFTSGTLTATCTDGPPYQRDLTGDYMVVATGGAGLLAQYYCPTGWSLRLAPGTTTAVAPANQMCVLRTTDSGTGVITTYNWSALELSLTASTSQTGSAIGHITGPFSASDGSSGSCNVTFSGQLSKP